MKLNGTGVLRDLHIIIVKYSLRTSLEVVYITTDGRKQSNYFLKSRAGGTRLPQKCAYLDPFLPMKLYISTLCLSALQLREWPDLTNGGRRFRFARIARNRLIDLHRHAPLIKSRARP